MTTYKTNHAATTKSLTEWYFGKAFVASMTAKAKRESRKTGKTEFRVISQILCKHRFRCKTEQNIFEAGAA